MEELPKDQTILNIKDHCAKEAMSKMQDGFVQTIDVHGHLQCVMCKTVIEDCCQGQPQK